MSRSFLIILSALLLVSFYQLSAYSYPIENLKMTHPDRYHVLELFTSQSCSSCPRADALLEELDVQDNIIALSCNVTYWNHLNWKDTLSNDFCTDKQSLYSLTQNRGGRIFTPELMINGTESMVGSNRKKIIDYLSNSSQGVHALDIEIRAESLVITSTQQIVSQNKVLLIPYGHKHTQDIQAGENRGRTINYTNPSLDMIVIAENWGGKSPINTIVKKYKGLAGYVVIISDTTIAGKTLAAGKIEL